jgi:cupin 2 domain-containing protein
MRAGNMKRGIPPLLPEELFTPLLSTGAARVERIVSRGHVSPPDFWYDQDEAELVVLLEGHARIEIEGEGELDLSPLDWLDLPARTRHRVTYTAPHTDTIWLAVFYASPASTAAEPAAEPAPLALPEDAQAQSDP